MNRSVSCRVEQPSSASPAAVYDALMDVERWPDWMPTVSAATWERHGAADTGLGGVRRVGNGLNAVRDTVVGGTRPYHHAYSASLIIWTVTCRPLVPGLRKLFRSRLNSVYTRLAAALAKEAERHGR